MPASTAVTSAAAFSLGRVFLGLAALASGILQLATGRLVRLAPTLAHWPPAATALAYGTGVVLVLAGLAILSGRMVRTAATALAVMALLMLVLLYPPSMVANPQIDRPLLRGFMYTNPLKTLALVGGAALLAGRLPDQPRSFRALGRGIGRWERLGPVLLAVFLIVCGLQHFAYLPFVTQLVPSWIPGPAFWTRFTGVALIAGGAGMLVRRTARLAAMLSALMIFLWVWMLHLPRAMAGPQHANEAAGVFEALALSGVALLVAGTRPVPQASEEQR